MFIKQKKQDYLLELFRQNPGRIFSQADIMDELNGSRFIGESNLVCVHICKIRKLLNDNEKIISIRGEGYVMEIKENAKRARSSGASRTRATK